MNNQPDHGAHDDATMLLPWYVNGTLDAEDRQRVDAHLDNCGQCRDELVLCQQMQNAIMADGAIPISPASSAAELILRQDQRTGSSVLGSRRVMRLAAALATVGLLLVFAVAKILPTEQPNQRFDAVTGEVGAAAVDYVLELKFSSGVPEAARSRILADLGAVTQPASRRQSVYTVMLRLPPQSLHELDRLAADIAARDEIEAAAFVALQVPVR